MKVVFILSLIVSSLCVNNLQFSENGFVARVIDGDTIELENGERIRLIGINAPDSGETCFEEATEKLEELILNKNVNLERDIRNIDDYGRSLRYVFVDGSFVNLEMIRSGYAYFLIIEPNTKYAGKFENAEILAEQNKLGCLWS